MGLDAARRLEQTISTQLFSSEFIFYTRRERDGRHADHLYFVPIRNFGLVKKSTRIQQQGQKHI